MENMRCGSHAAGLHHNTKLVDHTVPVILMNMCPTIWQLFYSLPETTADLSRENTNKTFEFRILIEFLGGYSSRAITDNQKVPSRKNRKYGLRSLHSEFQRLRDAVAGAVVKQFVALVHGCFGWITSATF